MLDSLKLGGILGATAVALGAFGAHGLKARPNIDPAMIKAWETAAHYHLLHAVAVTALAQKYREPNTSIKLLTIGTMLFSGSIYIMVLSDYRKLGIITPIGGLTLICGWLSLCL